MSHNHKIFADSISWPSSLWGCCYFVLGLSKLSFSIGLHSFIYSLASKSCAPCVGGLPAPQHTTVSRSTLSTSTAAVLRASQLFLVCFFSRFSVELRLKSRSFWLCLREWTPPRGPALAWVRKRLFKTHKRFLLLPCFSPRKCNWLYLWLTLQGKSECRKNPFLIKFLFL